VPVSAPVDSLGGGGWPGRWRPSSGRVSASVAKAASLRQRPVWEKETMAWAAPIGPIPGWSVSPGAMSLTIAASSAGLASGRLAQCSGEPADFGVSYGLLPGGACGLASASQPHQGWCR
jgi:hypothetical protein